MYPIKRGRPAIAQTPIASLYAASAQLEADSNELLMFVYHLETIERKYEATIPITIAMREIVR